MTSDEKEKPKQDVFHAHLDACRQCREHPFDLCIIGAALIRIVASDLSKVSL